MVLAINKSILLWKLSLERGKYLVCNSVLYSLKSVFLKIGLIIEANNNKTILLTWCNNWKGFEQIMKQVS